MAKKNVDEEQVQTGAVTQVEPTGVEENAPPVVPVEPVQEAIKEQAGAAVVASLDVTPSVPAQKRKPKTTVKRDDGIVIETF